MKGFPALSCCNKSRRVGDSLQHSDKIVRTKSSTAAFGVIGLTTTVSVIIKDHHMQDCSAKTLFSSFPAIEQTAVGFERCELIFELAVGGHTKSLKFHSLHQGSSYGGQCKGITVACLSYVVVWQHVRY